MKKSMRQIGLLLVAVLVMASCKKKEGCTDPTATNFDAEADKNCCCEYAEEEDSEGNTIVSGSISSSTTWTNDVVYELSGKVVVPNGVTLTINEGTIIKAQEGTGSLASALIVARGGKIMANGSSTKPIIFTSVLDNITVGQLAGTNLDENDRGLWGGLVVLGYAPISAENGDTETQIEGIPASETYGLYGGSVAADNSGVLHYVSVRHGGALIGAGNELNGITFGGVGTGTMVNHIEVVANVDDGVEFFGGTVDCDNVIVTYQGDDGIDIDMNYSGTVDNFMVIHGIDTDEGLEIDGPEGSTHTTGQFTLSNGTVISTDGVGSGSDLKSGAQGTITNVVWSGYSSKAIKLRASFSDTTNCTLKSDAYANLVAGSPTLTLSNTQIVGTLTMANAVDVYTTSMDGSGCIDPLESTAESTVGTTIVSAATVGATTSEFDGWSWSSIKNKY